MIHKNFPTWLLEVLPSQLPGEICLWLSVRSCCFATRRILWADMWLDFFTSSKLIVFCRAWSFLIIDIFGSSIDSSPASASPSSMAASSSNSSSDKFLCAVWSSSIRLIKVTMEIWFTIASTSVSQIHQFLPPHRHYFPAHRKTYMSKAVCHYFRWDVSAYYLCLSYHSQLVNSIDIHSIGLFLI